MYAGRIVERAPVDDVFDAPAHPYTRGLLASLPRIDGAADKLVADPGQPALAGGAPGRLPVPSALPACAAASAQRREPALRPVGAALAACHFAETAVAPATRERRAQ